MFTSASQCPSVVLTSGVAAVQFDGNNNGRGEKQDTHQTTITIRDDDMKARAISHCLKQTKTAGDVI